MSSRTSRFIWGVGLNYLNFGIVTLTGLWLTRFLLSTIGVDAMGSWVQLLQLTIFLNLLDLGVLALMPRDLAVVNARSDTQEQVQVLIGRYTQIVLLQTPIVALVALVGWWIAISSDSSVAIPLGIVLGCYTLLFPFRIGMAILNGLQDLRYVGSIQLISFTTGTLTTVGLAIAQCGIIALALGWCVNQLTTVLFVWLRIVRKHQSIWPTHFERVDRGAIRELLTKGLWASLATVGVMLTGNLDVLAIGRFQDAMEVLRYAFTTKLIMVVGGQVTVLCGLVIPGLADVRASGDEQKTLRVLSAYTQLVLLVSGWIACVLLMCNTSFVALWVGPQYNFDFPVTAVLIVVMMIRHWQNSLSVAMFLFQREKTLWIATCGEGLVNAAAMFSLAYFGAKWVCFAGLFGSALVLLPATVITLQRSGHWSTRMQLHVVSWWLMRFVPVAAVVIIMNQYWRASNVFELCASACFVSGLYMIMMLPAVSQRELGVYINPYIAKLKLPSWVFAPRKTIL